VVRLALALTSILTETGLVTSAALSAPALPKPLNLSVPFSFSLARFSFYRPDTAGTVATALVN